jgi:AraC-like DNA-binding protein
VIRSAAPAGLEERHRRRHSAEVQSMRSERFVEFVEDVRVVVAVPGAPLQVERLPDGKTAIVLRTLDDATGDAWVMGPRRRALFKIATGVARAVIVELRPGWASSMLGVAASALVDRHVALDELWGRPGAELRDELLAMRDASEIVDRLARALASRLERAGGSASARLARRAVQLLERGEDRVEEVAARLGVTARHLRRVFVESVGVGPKDFIRNVRLQRAVRSAGAADWGRVAADAGYYDQAHLIADFRDLVGLTPSAYARRAITPDDCGQARPG